MQVIRKTGNIIGPLHGLLIPIKDMLYVQARVALLGAMN